MCSPCDVLTVVWTTVLLCGQPPDLSNGSYTGPVTAYPGSVYDYTCDPGYGPMGENAANIQVECMENGKYNLTGDQLPVCGELCTNPSTALLYEYGEFNESFAGSYVQGDNVTFHCDEGYQAYPADGVIECGDTGWSADASCLEICPVPPGTAFASHNVTVEIVDGKYVSGSEITYTCDDSHHFRLGSTKTSTCGLYGNWSLETVPECAPICEVAPEIEHGIKTMVNNITIENGTVIENIIEYSCESGYTFLPSTNTTLECHPGTTPSWVPEESPTCYGVCEDPTPAVLPNGGYNATLAGSYIQGENVTFYCDSGHRTFPVDGVLECGDRVWDAEASCLAECAAPEESLFASWNETNVVISGGVYVEGSEITYTCEEDHPQQIWSSMSMTCASDGNWTVEQIPECVPFCIETPEIDNGTKTVLSNITMANGTIAEEQVQYSCVSGYSFLPSQPTTLDCHPGMSWLPDDAPVCYKNCPSLVTTEGMSVNMTVEVSGATLMYGTTYDVMCDVTHTISDHLLGSTECDANGDWTNSLPTCERNCGEAVEIPNGNKTIVTYATVSLESGVEELEQNVSYSCIDGYALLPESSEFLICGIDGDFAPDPPQCYAECPTPSTLSNAEFEITNDVYNSSMYVYGTQVTYNCNESYVYVPEGENVITCGVLGSWSALPGSCHLECPSLVSGGRNLTVTTEIYNGTRVAGTVYEMTCDDHHLISNHLLPLTTECMDDGNWTNSIPTCERDCGISEEIVNATKVVNTSVVITYDGGNQTLEHLVDYTCVPPLVLMPYGGDQLECGIEGEFVPVYPTCHAECPFLETNAHVILVETVAIIPGYRVPGTLIEFQCEENYTTTDTDVMTYCDEDGVWNMTTSPTCQLEDSATRTCTAEYEFFVTNETGSWYDVRAICQEAGGDLMHENFGYEPHGDKYFTAVRTITLFDTQLNHIYVGITNRDHDDHWRFIDGSEYNNTRTDIPRLFEWGPKEPNNWNTQEWCLEIAAYHTMNDEDCTKTFNNGLCEIKTVTCTDN